MRHREYLGRFGAALRWDIADARAVELIGDLARRLQTIDGDPVDVLGPPTALARQVVAAEGVGAGRRIRLGFVSALLMVAAIAGFVLLLRGSPLAMVDLVLPALLGVVVFVMLVAGSAPLVADDPRRFYGVIGVLTFALMIVGALVRPVFESATIELPSGRLLGVVLIGVSLAASFLVLRPLRFSADDVVQTDRIGRLIEG